jgi:protein TonB
VHAVILMHIASLYGSKALTVIELTLRDIARPPEREIPKPPPPPAPAAPRDFKEVQPTGAPLPVPGPVRAEHGEPIGLARTNPAPVAPPRILGESAPVIERWVPERPSENVDPNAPRAYLNMVRLRIEQHKKYPESARKRRIEGRTTVRFVIRPDGGVEALEVVTSAGSPALDRAATEAVRAASPFPSPPAESFKGPVPMELTIVFQLT